MNDLFLYNLYQPISKVNPQDAVSKLKYWSEQIRMHLLNAKQIQFSVSSVSSQFKRNDRSPACIDYVINELEKSSVIVPLSSFMAGPAWSVSSIIHSMSSMIIGVDKSPDRQYIHMDVIKEIESDIINYVDANERKLYTCAELARAISFDIDEHVLTVVLNDMSKSGVCAIDTCSVESCLAKFRSHPDTPATRISQSDLSIARCLSMTDKLSHERDDIISAIDQLTGEIIDMRCSPNKLKVLRMLRRRRRMTARLEWIEGVVDNLETIVAHHDQQQLDQSLWEVLRLSNLVRRVDVEELAVTMNDCREVLEGVDHVDWTTSLSGLEDEYEELVRTQEVVLPSVPEPPSVSESDNPRVAQLE